MAQSGWGFTVKQGATTIHEDSGIITHPLHRIASRGDNRTTHAIILSDSVSLLQKVKSGMGSPDWNVLMADIHLRKLTWVYYPGRAGVKRNDRANRLAGKQILTSVLFLGSSEVLRSLRHSPWAQSQGHHTIGRLEERGVKGLERVIVSHSSNELFQKRRWGNI